MSAAELADGGVEQFGLLEVAHVAGAWDHDERRVRNRVLELARDAERRAPSSSPQISRVGAWMRGSRSRWSVSAIADSAVHAPGRTSKPSRPATPRTRPAARRRTAQEAWVEQMVRGGQHLPDALEPGPHLLLGQRPLPAGVGVDEQQGRHALGTGR